MRKEVKKDKRTIPAVIRPVNCDCDCDFNQYGCKYTVGTEINCGNFKSTKMFLKEGYSV